MYCRSALIAICEVSCTFYHLILPGEMALHGHTVLLYDIDKDCLATALSRLDERKQQLHSDGLLSRAQDLDVSSFQRRRRQKSSIGVAMETREFLILAFHYDHYNCVLFNILFTSNVADYVVS